MKLYRAVGIINEVGCIRTNLGKKRDVTKKIKNWIKEYEYKYPGNDYRYIILEVKA